MITSMNNFTVTRSRKFVYNYNKPLLWIERMAIIEHFISGGINYVYDLVIMIGVSSCVEYKIRG